VCSLCHIAALPPEVAKPLLEQFSELTVGANDADLLISLKVISSLYENISFASIAWQAYYSVPVLPD
jgi:hypothetical protein